MSTRFIERVAKEKGYTVNEFGVVYSPISGKPLKLQATRKGYFRFAPAKDKRTPIHCEVHRFVAYHKFGDAIYGEGIHVRHLDCNHRNNNWSNIGIGTASQNMMDKPAWVRQRAAGIAGKQSRKNYHPLTPRETEGGR